MPTIALRQILSLLMPGGFLLLAAFGFLHFALQEVWTPFFIKVYPYAVLGIGIFFSLRFKRGRVFFGVLLLFIVDRLLRISTVVQIESIDNQTLFHLCAFLLPFNLVLFSQVKERGVINTHGIYRTILLFLQIIIGAYLLKYQPTKLSSFFTLSLFSFPTYKIVLPQIPFIAFILCIIAAGIRYFRTWGSIELGFFWALSASLFSMLLADHLPSSSLFLSTAGLILTASVIEAAYGMAFRDELTGLPSRRALQDTFMTLRGKYAVAMLDIDFFKKFNDKYGHDVGDQVLKMVATKLMRVTGSGKPFRYGGEEFTIIFSGKTVADALPHLEQLRQTIGETEFTIRNPHWPRKKSSQRNRNQGIREQVGVTVSIGAAENKNKLSPEEVMKQADIALYKAKQKGRNRIIAG